MVIVPNPAALKVWQLNFAFNDVGKNVWERTFSAVESGHGSNLEGGGGFVLHQYLGHGFVVVFGFNYRDGNVGLVKQRIVRAKHGALIAVRFIATYRHTAYTQRVFAKNLVVNVPACTRYGGADELFADVDFGELFLIQKSARWPILKLIGNKLFLTILVTL